MICEFCGLAAPTKDVVFHQNIGMIIVRFSTTAEGRLCKSCVHKTFWSCSLITLVLGWWGFISMIVTPFFLLNNLITYLFCLTMEPVPADAERPKLTQQVADRLDPFVDELVDGINSGEDFERVAERIANKAQVSSAQVVLFLHALIAPDDEGYRLNSWPSWLKKSGASCW